MQKMTIRGLIHDSQQIKFIFVCLKMFTYYMLCGIW